MRASFADLLAEAARRRGAVGAFTQAEAVAKVVAAKLDAYEQR